MSTCFLRKNSLTTVVQSVILQPMETTDKTSRLSQLTLQDYNGYLNAERPEALAELRAALRNELTSAEAELPLLEEEYRQLIKGDNTTRRMEVADRKNFLSRRSEEISRIVSDDEAMKILARRQYSKSRELQESLAEQRRIIDSIWGTK